MDVLTTATYFMILLALLLLGGEVGLLSRYYKNAPKEHFMLVLPLNAKEREKHEEYEQIVHRQRFLYQVTCQKFQCHLMRIARIKEVDTRAEQQRYAYPHGCHGERLTHIHLMLPMATEHLQICYQHINIFSIQ